MPYYIIAGKYYRDTFKICNTLNRCSREEVLLFQQKMLRKRLEYATSQIHFYKPFAKYVHQYPPFEALKFFPLITKTDVQENSKHFIPDCINKIPHHQATTGGTSGNQLIFNEDNATYAKEMGFMHSQWSRVGYTPKAKKATFRGVSFEGLSGNQFWQENPIHNEMQFSPFHITEQNLPKYIDAICDYKPSFVHGYPSSISVIAEYIIRNKIQDRLPIIKAVLLGSEGCSEIELEKIKQAFNAKTYSWYGQSERVVLGGECENTNVYHHIPSYGVLEIIGENGKECEVGDIGELVGTGFLNNSMPLIRYRTDDFAKKESHECECGRKWDRFSSVIDRRSTEGKLVGKNGAKISAAALNMHGQLFENVKRYQYYQDKAGLLEIHVIPNNKFNSTDIILIEVEHKKKLHDELDVAVKLVDDIPLAYSGKQKRIVCKIEK